MTEPIPKPDSTVPLPTGQETPFSLISVENQDSDDIISDGKLFLASIAARIDHSPIARAKPEAYHRVLCKSKKRPSPDSI